MLLVARSVLIAHADCFRVPALLCLTILASLPTCWVCFFSLQFVAGDGADADGGPPGAVCHDLHGPVVRLLSGERRLLPQFFAFRIPCPLSSSPSCLCGHAFRRLGVPVVCACVARAIARDHCNPAHAVIPVPSRLLLPHRARAAWDPRGSSTARTSTSAWSRSPATTPTRRCGSLFFIHQLPLLAPLLRELSVIAFAVGLGCGWLACFAAAAGCCVFWLHLRRAPSFGLFAPSDVSLRTRVPGVFEFTRTTASAPTSIRTASRSGTSWADSGD